MDFSTIKNLMEAKDNSGYKNVRDIYADVRLVFNNAMKYNVETDDVHVMAKTLLGKFEEKWLQLLPKVIEEERRRKKEEEEAKMNLQAAEEATVAKLAADLNNELDELNLHLDDLRERVVLNCRVMSSEEKRQLGANFIRLSPEDLTKALEIIAQKNPSFLSTAEEVDLDIDAQSPSTLWRLKFFVKEALDVQARGSVNKDNANPKRKREVNDAVNKNAKKRSKKITS
ncbi:Transcription factor [Nymphaea thermarum]|nr:Transcription factor [Nymphaea thermarum]